MTEAERIEVFEEMQELMKSATPGERAIICALNLIHDQMCLMDKRSRTIAQSVSAVAKQFDAVTAGGNCMVTEKPQ